jgi:hypothetical protein
MWQNLFRLPGRKKMKNWRQQHTYQEHQRILGKEDKYSLVAKIGNNFHHIPIPLSKLVKKSGVQRMLYEGAVFLCTRSLFKIF